MILQVLATLNDFIEKNMFFCLQEFPVDCSSYSGFESGIPEASEFHDIFVRPNSFSLGGGRDNVRLLSDKKRVYYISA